jgi:hypothetical protein
MTSRTYKIRTSERAKVDKLLWWNYKFIEIEEKYKCQGLWVLIGLVIDPKRCRDAWHVIDGRGLIGWLMTVDR